MKNLTLIIAMSIGLFFLGTFANSDRRDPFNWPKVYKRKRPFWLGKHHQSLQLKIFVF